jgi:peroxiredoxin (alkyl hydroperoxide reductase subunit C)
MGAWGRDLKVGKKVRMFGDGSAEFTKKLGMEFDLTARGLGVRSQRFAMIVDNGVVKHLALEGAGKFEVSDAASTLKHL